MAQIVFEVLDSPASSSLFAGLYLSPQGDVMICYSGWGDVCMMTRIIFATLMLRFYLSIAKLNFPQKNLNLQLFSKLGSY